MWPTWVQVGFQNRPKIENKMMQKSIEKVMHLGMDIWKGFGGFLEGKWKHVGTKIASNIQLSEKVQIAFGASLLMPNWVQGKEVGGRSR